MVKRSSCGKPLRRNTPILLSQIKHDSTCVTLKIPYTLACLICKSKLCLLTNSRAPRKKFRLIHRQNRCDQYWDEKWTLGTNASSFNIKKHNDIRTYLRIETVVNLEEMYLKNTSAGKNQYSARPAKIITTLPSTSQTFTTPSDRSFLRANGVDKAGRSNYLHRRNCP